jgi:hypothetical protein
MVRDEMPAGAIAESTNMPEQANPGGPRIGKPNRSGKSLKVFFDPPEYARLKEFCESTDRTMTVVVRRAVSEYLGRQEDHGSESLSRPARGKR